MRPRQQVESVRDQIPGANYHELAMELFRTIDDASARIATGSTSGMALVAKAIYDLEARLETIEDAVRLVASRLHEIGPVR